MRKELLQGLSEEQIKKVESCKDSSEMNLMTSSLRLLLVELVQVIVLADVQNVVLRILSIR